MAADGRVAGAATRNSAATQYREPAHPAPGLSASLLLVVINPPCPAGGRCHRRRLSGTFRIPSTSGERSEHRARCYRVALNQDILSPELGRQFTEPGRALAGSSARFGMATPTSATWVYPLHAEPLLPQSAQNDDLGSGHPRPESRASTSARGLPAQPVARAGPLPHWLPSTGLLISQADGRPAPVGEDGARPRY
jgi:hypothetical protein